MRQKEFEMIDIYELASLDMIRWIKRERPKLVENTDGFEEIQILLNSISGDIPVVNKKYSVLMLIAVPIGKMLILIGHKKPIKLKKIINQKTYSQFEFIIGGKTVKYPNILWLGDRLTKTILFSDILRFEQIKMFIHLRLIDWDIRDKT